MRNRLAAAALAAGTLLLAATWLWRLRFVVGRSGLVVSAFVLAGGFLRPRRALVFFAAALPLLPILSAIYRGPDFSWAELIWLWLVAGCFLSRALRKEDAAPRTAAPEIFWLGLFLFWAGLSAAAAVLPALAPDYRPQLAAHLLASSLTLLDPLGAYFPIRAWMVLFEASLAVAIIRLLGPGAGLRDRFRRAVFASAGLVSLYAIVEFVFHLKLWPPAHYDVVSGYRRVASTLPDPNALGSFLAFALVWVWRTRQRRQGKVRDLYAALLLLLAFALLLSGSRIAWVSVAILGFFLWLRERRALSSFRWGVRGLLAAGFLIVAAAAIPEVRQRFELTFRSTSVSDLLLGRSGFFSAAGRMVRAHPVTGIGEGRFYRDLDSYRPAGFPIRHENTHNYFLQVASETGIVGLLLFLAALATLLAPGSDGDLRLALAAFGMTLLFGHALLVPEVAVLIFLAFGLAQSERPAGPPLIVRVAIAAFIAAIGLAPVAAAARAPSTFSGFGVSAVKESGGPGGHPQFWGEDDLFAVPDPQSSFELRQPNRRFWRRTWVSFPGLAAQWPLRQSWMRFSWEGRGGERRNRFRWVRTGVVWCPASEDPLSLDRRLLSVRVSP